MWLISAGKTHVEYIMPAEREEYSYYSGRRL